MEDPYRNYHNNHLLRLISSDQYLPSCLSGVGIFTSSIDIRNRIGHHPELPLSRDKESVSIYAIPFYYKYIPLYIWLHHCNLLLLTVDTKCKNKMKNGEMFKRDRCLPHHTRSLSYTDPPALCVPYTSYFYLIFILIYNIYGSKQAPHLPT